MDVPDNRDLFRKYGLKNTKNRSLIFEILKSSEFPLTPESVFLKLKEVDASVSFSTVYRILDIFTEKGIALRTNIGNEKKAAFELNRLEHKHRLVCINCKKMIAIEDCPLDMFEKSLEMKTQFDITSHKLEIYGYCPACKDKEQ